MKLFIREHLLLIIVQCIQMGAFMGILLLARFDDIAIIAYCIFISFFILLLYLIYMYWTRKNFYKKMSNSIAALDVSLEKLDMAPISKHLQKVLKTQYNAYESNRLALEKKQEQYFMFLDRWIHQMKTPVSVLNLMAKDLDEPEASNFQEEIDRLQKGLNMVLYMSRVRMMEHDFRIQRLDLLLIVQDVMKEHKRLFIRNKVYPKIHIPENTMIETDEKWFHFIWTQLIENAVKYSTGKSNRIDIFYTETNKRKVLSIADEGVGIPGEDIQRIFDPFYTGENGRVFRESTGIGLYLVQEVCTYLGHHIEVESTVHKGTTFHLVF